MNSFEYGDIVLCSDVRCKNCVGFYKESGEYNGSLHDVYIIKHTEECTFQSAKKAVFTAKELKKINDYKLIKLLYG